MFLVLIFAPLIGCAQPGLLQSDNLSQTQNPTITPAETLILKETRTPDIPSKNVSPIDGCLTVESGPISDWNLGGILILGSTEDIGNNLVRRTGYKINMDTMETIELVKPEERLRDLAVSPNGKWLAYEIISASNKKPNLVISNASSDQQLVIPWEAEWIWIATWLDDNRLLIGLGANSYLVFNPFTGERQLFKPDIPGVFSGQGITGLTGRSFNPALDRAVYLEDKLLEDGSWHYVLWAIDQQQSLADFRVIIQPTAFPWWSPDGTKFAIANSVAESYQGWPAYELFSVNGDGETTQLSNLSTFFPFVYIDQLSWSPDARHLAFWFSWWPHQPPDYDYGIPDGERYLAIVDTEKLEIRNYCILGNFDISGRIPAPVWSPDGTHLAVVSPSTEGHSQVVLVDLSNERAIRIGKDMIPIGWMVAP